MSKNEPLSRKGGDKIPVKKGGHPTYPSTIIFTENVQVAIEAANDMIEA